MYIFALRLSVILHHSIFNVTIITIFVITHVRSKTSYSKIYTLKTINYITLDIPVLSTVNPRMVNVDLTSLQRRTRA